MYTKLQIMPSCFQKETTNKCLAHVHKSGHRMKTKKTSEHASISYRI